MSNTLRAALRAFVFIAGALLLASSRPTLAAAPYTWKTVTIGGGGYVTDVCCHPREKDLVYIRTDVGGFYRWDPAGVRWIPLNEQFSRERFNYYGGEGLALDPADPNVVYIAAGKYEWATPPGALFRSTDRGRTWKKLPLDLKMGGNEDQRWAGPRLVVNPSNPRILLFASRADGLWRSSDAGASWAKVSAFPGKLKAGIGITSLAFDAKTAGVVYAAAHGDAVYRSADAGLTWARMEGSPSEVERMAPASDGTLYATHGKGVARCSGGQWANITPPGVDGGFGGCTVNPADSRDVLVAAQKSDLTLLRSMDGGATWQRLKTVTQSSAPWYSVYMKQIQYVAGLTFDPCVPGRIWLTDWYATYRADDLNADPVVMRNFERGHEELVVFNVVAPAIGPLLLSGVADVDGFAHQSLDEFPAHGLGEAYGGKGPSFGDTDQIAWCPGAPGRLARVGLKRWDNTGNVTVSSDGGGSWSSVASWDQKVMPGRIALSATDPNNMVVLRIGAGAGLYTTDGGASWKPVSGLPDNLVPSVWYWQTPLAADGGKAGVFYAVSGSTLYRSADAGATFAPAAVKLPEGGQTILQTVPGKAGELWLARDKGGLLHSIDGGQTFRPVPSVKTAFLFAPGKAAPGTTRAALYLYGTLANGRSGIFRSLTGGASWEPIGDPRVPIGCEPNSMTGSWQVFGLVFIGTNGRGVYYGVPQGTTLPKPKPAPAAKAPTPVTKTPAAVGSKSTASGFPNGDMTRGGASPEGWAINWRGSGQMELVRDTQTFQAGPASLCLRSVGGAATAAASHPLAVTKSPFTLSGYVRSEGQIKSTLLAIQVFVASGKQVDWINLAMPKPGDWQGFSSKVTLPASAASAQLALTFDGDGKVWVDELSLDAGKPQLDTEAAALPVKVAPVDPRIRYVGRFDTSEPAGPRCSWSASTVALRFEGSALNVKLEESSNSDEYEVVVDGKPAVVLVAKQGAHLYRLFSAQASGQHTVELVKRTESFFGVSRFLGFELSAGGRLLALPARPSRRIEVIGDSISCGYGNEAANQNEHFSSVTENAYMTYGAIAARALGAEYICLAWSGRLMTPKNTMGEVYDRILATEANSRWDFARWKPDVVVINLGTNDFAGGIPERAAWIQGYQEFLARVRKNYPKAAIYCATSPMMFGKPYDTEKDYLSEIVRAANAAGDRNVRLLPVATQDGANGFGADWHPSAKTHQIMADQLISTLDKDLGWKPLAKR